MIELVPQNFADLRLKGFNPIAGCAYHSNAQGHNTGDCQCLKSEVEKMIQTKMIVVENDNLPNVAHNDM